MTAEPVSIMSKSRFEAFSDGVFAVAVTLLVLDFKAPNLAHASPAQALGAILGMWKPLLSYATSFIVVGTIWINHHTLFHAVERVDRMSVIVNLILLMLVALIPFPTALIGEYSNLQPIVMVYGLVLFANGVVFNVLFGYVRTRYKVVARIGADPMAVRLSTLRGISYPLGYLIASLLSYVSTTISIVFYIALPIFYLFPSPVEYQLTRSQPKS